MPRQIYGAKMKHCNEIELIEYVSGRMSDEQASAVAEHLEECADCRNACVETRSTWECMGTWQPQPPQKDLTGAVLAEVGSVERSPRSSFAAYAVRIAASILIAVSTGHMMARLSLSNEKPGTASEPANGYIAALGLDWSSNLTRAVLESETAEETPQNDE